MFRLTLLVCVSLLFYGNTAKPFKPLGKVADAAFQETLMDFGGKMSVGLREVEPPEDMDVPDNDIDPNMAIWKNMAGNGLEEKYFQAEEDGDDLSHPSMGDSQMADLLRAQPQPEYAFPGLDVQIEPLEQGDNFKYYEEAEVDLDAMSHIFSDQMDPKEPEEDRDELYHRVTEQEGDGVYQVVVPNQEELTPLGDFSGVHTIPEEDRDSLYHGDKSVLDQVDILPQKAEVRHQVKVIHHKQPEEDRDYLYHADLPASGSYQQVADTRVAAQLLSDWAVPRKHSKPEEDLDHLYHN